MPSLIKSVLYFDGCKPSEIKSFVESDGKQIDFNKILPMPNYIAYDKAHVNSRESLGAYKYLQGEPMDWFIRNLVELYQRDNEPASEVIDRLIAKGLIDLEVGKTIYLNEQRYGDTNWCKWVLNNWNSAEPYFNEAEISDDKMSFNTQWSAPVPIIDAIANHFPKGYFRYIWSDEICTDSGEIKYYNGKAYDENRPDGGTSEAREIFDEVWEVVRITHRIGGGGKDYEI